MGERAREHGLHPLVGRNYRCFLFGDGLVRCVGGYPASRVDRRSSKDAGKSDGDTLTNVRTNKLSTNRNLR